ncbi:sodium:alanine symporter family protein [Proteiniclasticum sp. QWL-01]|uniref:alanine/glycine:cation symporter family protein n=1 Tax=Proteiniclasticum sp. QWL-01 TaxID=3036945 RepID=UPI0024109337|nr:sodium:alanine symporter family protein [Proteiniclasticum sp. QWL-01]WFF72419.1 sodium:alanine symporter family protein [Proteiniclasticum sp. QWL-01]
MEFLNSISAFLWNYILLFALLGVGLYMTVLLKFPQFTRVLPAITKLIGDIKSGKKVEDGRMTPFQSLATAVAAQVGTGNIVGVATAIAAGGPGAAFWMILSAFFGMATIFAEAVLAQIYRHQSDTGELSGGPAYYIRDGLKSKVLARIFAVFAILSLGIVGIMVQSNAVVVSLNESFGIPMPWATAGLLALVGVILTGGMERIAGFSEKVVPLMAGAYVLGSLLIVVINITQLIPALQLILVSAFSPQAIGGGVLGITVQETVRFGIARGLFSNEAGMGSTPHSHAVAQTDHPAEQGFIAMIGVFISTFMICTSTVMVNVLSGSYDATISAAEMSKTATIMTQNAFTNGFGNFGGAFLSVSLSSFALTTIVGWYFFAESNVRLIFQDKKIFIIGFKIIALSFLVVGPFIDPDNLWKLSDLFTGLMALPNIVALIFLSRQVDWILKDYDQKNKLGELKWPDLNELPGRRPKKS